MNRKLLLAALGPTPRSLSDLATQFGVSRRDVEVALPHIVRSARAAGRRLLIVPARCRECGGVIEFNEELMEYLALQVERETGFVTEWHEITLHGRCAACSAAS